MTSRTDIQFHHGRNPNDPSKPRVKLEDAVNPAAITPVPGFDRCSEVSDWPMYLNNSVGDCTIAGAGHLQEAWSTYGQKVTHKITDADVLFSYEAVSGYNPQTGQNDNGAVMQDVLNYWRKTGIGGNKILAFAEVSLKDHNVLRWAGAVFGGLYLGMKFPKSAMQQFQNHEPWHIDPSADNSIEGGHCIHGAAYDPANGVWKVITWGEVQEMTDAFFTEYVEEAWVAIDGEMFDLKTGLDVEGLDLHAIGDRFATLTGEPNPFPEDNPTPAPAPSPSPSPESVDKVLAEALQSFLDNKDVPHYLRGAAVSWLQAKGF